MGLWDTVVSWVNRDARKFMYAPIPADHVDSANYNQSPMVAGGDYFRLWLSEMYLRKDRTWFQNWHPAVHSLVRLQFGTEQLEIPYIAGPLTLRDISVNNLDRVVQLNYPLTPHMPFNGGVVEIMAGLFALEGQSYIDQFVKVMSDFADLLNVPQLSAALNVAVPVANGVQELLRSANGGLHLGFHQAFTGKGGNASNELKAGYYAVILAEASQISPDQLWVVGDRLNYGSKQVNNGLAGYSYMLFRLENRKERDDWTALKSIAEPRSKALEALVDGESDRAKSLLQRAVIAAQLSPDRTITDRRRVIQALRDEYNELSGAPQAAVGARTPDLGQLVQRISHKEAFDLGEPRIAELFA